MNGLITDCGRIVGEGKKSKLVRCSTLKEPYRIEGKKTMGLKSGSDQFEWELPDVISGWHGGGTGLIGMWKAFAELEAMGWG